MENRDVKLKVAEFILQLDRETGFIKHDTKAYIFPVASAMYWHGINKGIAGEYRPGCGIHCVLDDEEDTRAFYDDFCDWTKVEMEALSLALEIIWDEATKREES